MKDQNMKNDTNQNTSNNRQPKQSNGSQNNTQEPDFVSYRGKSITPRTGVEYIPKPGVTRYNSALSNLIPLRYQKVEKDKMPADSAGLFSYVFFTWMTPYIWKGYKKRITLDDIPLISPYDTCRYNTQRLEVLWQKELVKHGPSLASFPMVAWRFVRTRVCAAWFLLTCSTICGFVSPMILMRKILEHVQSPNENMWDGMKWAGLLLLCDLLRTTFFTWTWCTNIRTGLRLKAACTTLLYKKIIRLNSLENRSSGELTNLFSNDSQRLFDTIIYGPMIIAGPLSITFGVVYILWLFNPLALLGITAFLAFYPCQYLISRVVGYFRSKVVIVTDARVKLMNEILDSIKMIKMCSWERYFSRNLLDIRKQEQRWLHKTAYFQSLSISLTPAVPIISAIITFLSQTASGSNLTAAQAFPIATFFGNMLRLALTSLKDSTRFFLDACIALRRFKVFPFVSLLNSQIRTSFMFLQVALVSIAESKITLNRLKSVILLEESTCHVSKPIVKTQAVAIGNGTFVCRNSTSSDSLVKSSRNKRKETVANSQRQSELESLRESSKDPEYVEILTDIKFQAAKCTLVGVCGQVGSGKTSLLLAALGQLKIKSGHVFREGSCAYVSQQAWILNTTLRENILFGEQFDTKLYYQALTICNLKEDLNMLPGGDETEIGERGINLSGGQKQRVALARAFYANKDIYFLDDPLSAVDPHVGTYIFENLILDALKNKSVIFVTHQVQFLKHCHEIYFMNEGKIVEHGTHEQLMELDSEYAGMVNTTLLESENNAMQELKLTKNMKRLSNIACNTKERSNSVNENGNNDDDPKKHKAGAVLTKEEKVETGSVKSSTYHVYVKAAGGYIVAAIVFFTLFLSVGSSAFSTWWLAVWIKAGGGNITDPKTNETIYSDNINDNPHMSYYQDIYAGCIGVILLTSLLRGLVIMYTTISASTTLHNKVLNKLMAAPLTFFETNPSGRIQNVFSRDIDEVDNYLPISIENMIQNIFVCSCAMIFICSIVPWFTLPLIILGAIFIYISRVFRAAMRDFKRMESTSRSPVLSFITTTIQGLNTIHAFQKEKEFLRKFEELFDFNNLCLYLCQSAMRWSAVRLDSLAMASSSITAFLIIALKGQIPPALAGLAMAYATQMSGVFQYTVRLMSETEARFISVERINYYLKSLQAEGTGNETPTKTPSSWPNRGKIEFRKVSLKYRKELQPVLFDISFTANPGEKIGIIGRTGSGKSSLVAALFRLVELHTGKIKIDNIDISNVDLEILRRKLSIIPQDPVLFSGTIRSNLDPLKQHDDIVIWNVLEKTQLKQKIQSMTGQLDAIITIGGTNLSAGERQLLCLARALLCNSKILILDEATAAVDPETELAVQSTIQNEFSACTVLTIAHRLKTIATSDRIIVMSAGRIIECDTPMALLSNPDSEFSKMMAHVEYSLNEP